MTATEKRLAFLRARLAYIGGLKQPTEQQRLFAELAGRLLGGDALTAKDARDLKTLEAAEKADERAQAARRQAAKILSEKSAAERKARTRNLIQAGGLLVVAGFADRKTGLLAVSPAELVGALAELAARQPSPIEREAWKRAGEELLSASKSAKGKA